MQVTRKTGYSRAPFLLLLAFDIADGVFDLKNLLGVFVGNFNAFDLVYTMQGALAGPDKATDILGTFLYRTFFGFQLQIGDPNMGSAIASMMFFIILVGVCIYLFAIQTRLKRYQF